MSEGTSGRARCTKRSGAMNIGVPSTSAACSSDASTCVATPKSISVGTVRSPRRARITFAGVMSPCASPHSCTASTPASSGSITAVVTESESFPLRAMRACSDSPTSFSITNHGPCGSTPASSTRAMFGCATRAIALASAVITSPRCGSLSRSRCGRFSATVAPVTRSTASKTDAMPPRPSCRRGA